MLPVQLTSFVGREHELATVHRLLETSRLLTLTGAGGSGKTRLALETIATLPGIHTRDVAWVELAAVPDASTLASHLATALHVRADGGVTVERATVAMLRDRELLLVLDNCEHIVDACARLVELLLHGCPGLRVLATSREALGVTGERSWLVPALSVGPADVLALDDAAACESVQLFVERARDVLPAFTLTSANVGAVSQLCRRLDGLPLAIELAAARVTVLTPQEIASRLDDRFALLTSSLRTALPRQRTLRAAVDWSYDLLGEQERLLLERLSVFAGGFTLDMAEQVCADDALPARDVLDALSSLTTRSMVAMQEAQGCARYRLLETIREYAALRRRERGCDAPVRDRHAACLLALAQEAMPELILGRPARLQQLDAEDENVRAALAWSAERRAGATLGLPLGWAMIWYWFHRQHWAEGFRHLQTALSTADDPDDSLQAAAMHGMGFFGMYAGDPESRARLERAEAIWRRTGNVQWLTFTLMVRTVEASLRQAPAEARTLAEEAVRVARLVPDPWHEALAMAHALVPVMLWEGEYAAAAAQLAVAERVYRERDYTIGVAYLLDARGFTAFQGGDLRGAIALACAALREAWTGENRWLAGRSLRTLAAVAMRRDDDDRATRLYAAADALYEAIAFRSLTSERRAVNEGAVALQARMEPAAYAAARESGRAMSLAAAAAYALEVEVADDGADDGSVALPQLSVTAEIALPVHDVLRVRVLGALEIMVGDVIIPPDAWRYARPRELLLYLLLHPGGRTREQIGLDFWPESSAAQVKNNFHVTLHHLRKAIGRTDIVRYERDRYRVAFEDGVELDAARFESLARPALQRLSKGAVDAHATRDLSEAVALYRGPLLETEPVGDWHLELRDRFAQLHTQALQVLGAQLSSSGDHAAAVDVYRRALDNDSLDEEVLRQLMLALARSARRADALRRFDRFREVLARELEAEPDRETLRLAESIRQGGAV